MNTGKLPTRFAIAVAIWFVFSIVSGVIFVNGSTENEWAVALRTIGLGASAALIAIPIGGLIAWGCLAAGVWSRALLVCTLAMLLVPMFIHVSSWDAAFGKLGWLTSVQGQILTPLISGWSAAVWIHGIAAAPQVALILMIGIGSGRREFEEQALLDTSAAGVFFTVTLRRLLPLVLLSFLWIVISCAREIGVTDLYQIGTLAEQIYLGFSLGINSIAGTWTPEQLAEANSISHRLTLAMLVWFAATSFLFFFLITDLETESNAIRPVAFNKPSRSRSWTAAVLLLLMVLVPAGNVVVRACFFVRPINGVPTQGYSLSQMVLSVRRAVFDYQDEFVWSTLIALASASIIIVLATAIAVRARKSRLIQIAFAMTLAVCCAIPGPYIGTALSGWLAGIQNETLAWFYNYTIAAPVLANLIFCWPLGAVLVWFVVRKIPEDALESAVLEGAGASTRFVQIGLKGNWAAMLGCWFLTFAFCFGELSASQIVRPAGIDTVPRKMLGDLHAGVNELTAGITIVTAFTIVAVSLVGWWFIRLNRAAIGRQ
ncbi:MAG: iron(III) transport system permease protein [Mariniblastus sp.]|jgi:iron(III) transport system permease protein